MCDYYENTSECTLQKLCQNVKENYPDPIQCSTSGSHLFCGLSDQPNDIFPLKTDHLVRWLIHWYILPLKTDHLVGRTTEQV